MNKQLIEQAYSKAGINIDSIRIAPLGGFYVYHNKGSEGRYIARKEVERTENSITYERTRKLTKRDFIDDEFGLKVAVFEAGRR